MKHPPKIVTALCYSHEAWICGSAIFNENPRDWDIVVPFENWFGAAFLIPKDAIPNSFGGWKFTSDG